MNDTTTDVIVSERLMLPLLTASRLERILGGDLASVEKEIGVRVPTWWASEFGRHMRLRLSQIRANPLAEPWLIRPIATRDRAEVIGLTNFHGPPDERGFAEIGYSLQPEHRGQGYAIEAVRALFGWATREHGVSRFRASISPDNDRSINLATRLGMTRVGAQWDEDDGLELIFAVEGWARA